MIAVDTDVVIDVLRQHPAAVAWLGTIGQTPLAFPGFVLMEVLQGCRDAAEVRHARAQLSTYRVLWPSVAACDAAVDTYASLRLSHGIGLLDSLIAHTTIEAGLILHTLNPKHYSAVPGLQAVRPYTK